MIKITFRTDSGNIYWAACERMRTSSKVSNCLDSVMEDSDGRGPLEWAKVPANWQVLRIEEV